MEYPQVREPRDDVGTLADMNALVDMIANDTFTVVDNDTNEIVDIYIYSGVAWCK